MPAPCCGLRARKPAFVSGPSRNPGPCPGARAPGRRPPPSLRLGGDPPGRQASRGQSQRRRDGPCVPRDGAAEGTQARLPQPTPGRPTGGSVKNRAWRPPALWAPREGLCLGTQGSGTEERGQLRGHEQGLGERVRWGPGGAEPLQGQRGSEGSWGPTVCPISPLVSWTRLAVTASSWGPPGRGHAFILAASLPVWCRVRSRWLALQTLEVMERRHHAGRRRRGWGVSGGGVARVPGGPPLPGLGEQPAEPLQHRGRRDSLLSVVRAGVNRAVECS